MHLRQSYHFGPARIAMYLKRYHDVEISSSGVWRILQRLGLGRLPANQRYKRRAQRWKRYEKQRPGHRVQIDVKLRRPDPRRHRQAALPVHRHRRLHPAEGAAHLPQSESAHRNPIPRLPHRAAPVPDRGDPDRQRSRVPRTGFHWHVLDRGIGHVYIKPATPRLNGKVERSHRIDAEEFYRLLEGVTIDDTDMFNDRLREWEDYYNFERPHSGLDGQTPYERLKQKTSQP